MRQMLFILFTLAVALPTRSFSQDRKEVKETKPAARSVVKEVQAFHKMLHPLVHDALPNGDFARIRQKLENLLEGATAIQQAEVPKKLVGRQKEVEGAAEKLVSQLEDMIAAKDIVDDATLEKLFNDMHETYEQLAEILK